MKTSVLLLAAALWASTNVLAAPSAVDARADAAAAGDLSILADNCFHKSTCSVSWGGKGEGYCDKRGFSHMTRDGCGWNPLKKAVCCIRA